jgi:oligopeptide transport system permease protein
MAVALIGISVPPFVVGPLLQLLFGLQLEWLPTAGLDRGRITVDRMILPVITLALPQIAILSRLMRASMIEVIRSNYIRTARAKGLAEWRVILGHALRAAAPPLVSYLGPAAAALVTGSLVIEQVFALPGIGRQFVIGALQRDYTVVMGVVILYSTLIILMNLAADLILAWLDPKVREQ